MDRDQPGLGFALRGLAAFGDATETHDDALQEPESGGPMSARMTLPTGMMMARRDRSLRSDRRRGRRAQDGIGADIKIKGASEEEFRRLFDFYAKGL